jgi:CDP-6-deoxy-D-xylo-4-hexulose-3-dehydrase
LVGKIAHREGARLQRLELVTFLEENNIQTRPVFTGNILKQPGFAKVPHRLAQKAYPNAENIMRNALVVGAHHGLAPEQVQYMKEKFDEFLTTYKERA